MQTTLISTLVAVDSEIDLAEVEAVLALTAGIEPTGIVQGLDRAWEALAADGGAAILLACQPDSESALWFIRNAVRTYPGRPVVVVSAASENGFVRHAFDAGAEDLVMPTQGIRLDNEVIADQIRFALEKAVARRTGTTSSGPAALASLICVLGPKGGIGKTLTTANLAVGLAMAGRRVAVVDLDLQFGDVGLSLALEPKRTIYDLIKSGGSMDAEKVADYLTPHPTGVKVLMAPTRPDQASAVTIEFLRELYPLLRESFDFVVVDTPPGFSPEVIASIDSSTHVCLVGMLDSLSLKNTKLGLETLDLMGYGRDRIRLVLNRADSKVGVTQEDVIAVLGRKPDVLVPSHRDVARSVNEGSPVVASRPRSDAARAFAGLAAAYLGPATPKRSGRKLARRKG